MCMFCDIKLMNLNSNCRVIGPPWACVLLKQTECFLCKQKCLKFPRETEVTSDAMNLMKCLLTDADRRLKYEGICIHRFFSDIDFDNIRQSKSGILDQQLNVHLSTQLSPRHNFNCWSINYVFVFVKVCSHVTNFILSPMFCPLLFSIVSMVTGWILGWIVRYSARHHWHNTKQECIPVGCVPAAIRPYGTVWSGGCLLRGGRYPSMHWGRHPPPRGQNFWHMLVKILPWPNFVTAGNNNGLNGWRDEFRYMWTLFKKFETFMCMHCLCYHCCILLIRLFWYISHETVR